MKIKEITKEWLIEQNHILGKSTTEICQEFEITNSTLWRKFHKLNVKILTFPEKTLQRYKQTCLEKYGVENPNQLEYIKEKKKETCFKHYGVNYSLQNKSLQQKFKKTMMERYGVENPSQSKDVQENIKQACLQKYGVQSINQLDSVKEKKKQTILNHYGVDHYSKTKEYKEQFKKTSLQNYGVEHPSQSKSIKEKRKKTNIKKYGVNHYSKTNEFKKKYKQTCLEKYGVENPQQYDEFKKKTQQTCLKKYGTEHHQQKHILKESLEKLNNKEWLIKQHHNQKKSLEQIAAELNVSTTLPGKYCKKHCIETKSYGISFSEKELVNFIKSFYCGTIIENDRQLIRPYELDVFLPELNLAFEYNGTYWHKDKPKGYHENKTKRCKNKKVKLLHIWEDDWEKNKKQIQEDIKELITNRLNSN